MKKSNLLKRAWQFAALGIMTLTGFESAYSIVELKGVPAVETPHFLKGFETAVKSREHSSESRALKDFGFGITEHAQDALNEIAKAETASGRGHQVELLQNEFLRIQNDLISRGYEPSRNTYWAPPQKLIATFELAQGNEFIYRFHFAFQLSYQKKGTTLNPHDKYPQAFLNGILILQCQERLQNCFILNASFEQAGISWKQIPGPRGGNSSAGGGGRDGE